MIAAILVFVSVYLAVRVAVVELVQNLQDIYNKWEEKVKPKLNSLGGSQRHSPRPRKLSGPLAKHYQNGQRDVIPAPTPQHWNNRIRSRFKSLTITSNGPRTLPVGQFKMAPTILPENPLIRPFMGMCCSRCVPASRMQFAGDPAQTLGISNILRVPTQNRGNGLLARTFSHATFIIQREPGFIYPDATNRILCNERVQAAIEAATIHEVNEKNLSQDAVPVVKKKHKRRAVQILRNMKCCISGILMRISGWVMYKLLSRILTSIQIHKGQIEILKRLSEQTTVPMVYLPLHRSHLDYILITFLLYMNDLRTPIVAAGDNLVIPVFGALMRGLGAFFIKRKLDWRNGRKDFVYRSILHTYMVESLKDGHSLEFFIEGGRSRSGKACLPKAGLLSVVVDAIMDGTVEDAYVVPVAISYEKILDGNFNAEQLGRPKVMESFRAAVIAIWRTLHSNFGSVRVDFCQPFSLKEFLHTAKQLHYITPERYTFANMQKTGDLPSLNSLRSIPSSGSLYGTDIVLEDQRQLIKGLAEHIVYDASSSTAIMSTNILAFLFMTKHRKGATLQQLAQSLNWLREEIVKRKRDVGFTGESADVIRHACVLLGKDLVGIETILMEWSSGDMENNNVKIFFFKPVLRLPHVLELQYYANSVVSVFTLESIIANAIFALLDEAIESWQGCDSRFTVARQQLVQKALQLCDILQYEFIFAPPCSSLTSVIDDTIDSLITDELLVVAGTTTLIGDRETAWSSKQLWQWEESSEDDDDHPVAKDQMLKISLKDESVNTLQFLRCVLSTFIESYWLASCSLLKLVRLPREESLFCQDMQKAAQERLHRGLLLYEESFAAEPQKNAVKLFEHWKVVESHSENGVKILYLHTDYDSEEAVNEVISRIEEFKK